MSVFTTRPATRWLVPAVAALAIIGGGVVVRTAAAAADPTLPPRTAAQLLVDLQTAKLDAMSGTVVQHADLGLPALPTGGGQGSSDLASLVSGDHTLRVWYSGPDKARIALLGTLGESDVITNGTDLWIWDSRENSATHRRLAPGERPTATGDSAERGLPSAMPSTPQDVADQALKLVDPSTVVTTAGSARVAGRAAYELVLAPRDRSSLVGQVRLAIDAEHHVPLRVQVYPRGTSEAAIEVAFTQISFNRPDDSQFRFAPPPGATINEQPSTPDSPGERGDAKEQDDAGEQPVIIGSGWTSVLAARMPGATPSSATTTPTPAGSDDRGASQGQLTAILDNLPRVSGSWGTGRLLSGRLFSVLLTDDGRVLAGAVAPDRLYQAAADPKALALKATK